MMQTYSFINSFCSLSRKKLKGKCHEIFSPVAWHKTAPKINVVESILTGLGDPPFPHNFKIHGSRLLQPCFYLRHLRPLFICWIISHMVSDLLLLQSYSHMHKRLWCHWRRGVKLSDVKLSSVKLSGVIDTAEVFAYANISWTPKASHPLHLHTPARTPTPLPRTPHSPSPFTSPPVPHTSTPWHTTLRNPHPASHTPHFSSHIHYPSLLILTHPNSTRIPHSDLEI